MNSSFEVDDELRAAAGVLLGCFVLSFSLLLLWFCFFLVAADFGYQIHSRWFALSRHEFDLLHYCGMGIVKIVAFVGFLFPYLSIRLVLRARKKVG